MIPTDSQELPVNGYTNDLANGGFKENSDTESVAQREEASDKIQRKDSESDKIVIVVVSVASVTLISALVAYITILKKSKK